MGFDLITVDDVPRSDHSLFANSINSDNKGFFQHNQNLTSVLSHIGVNLESDCHRQLYGHKLVLKGVTLWRAINTNMGYQVTPEECEAIASMILSEKEKLHEALENQKEKKNPEDVEFYLDYATFCKAASLYGGFYVC